MIDMFGFNDSSHTHPAYNRIDEILKTARTEAQHRLRKALGLIDWMNWIHAVRGMRPEIYLPMQEYYSSPKDVIAGCELTNQEPHLISFWQHSAGLIRDMHAYSQRTHEQNGHAVITVARINGLLALFTKFPIEVRENQIDTAVPYFIEDEPVAYSFLMPGSGCIQEACIDALTEGGIGLGEDGMYSFQVPFMQWVSLGRLLSARDQALSAQYPEIKDDGQLHYRRRITTDGIDLKQDYMAYILMGVQGGWHGSDMILPLPERLFVME